MIDLGSGCLNHGVKEMYKRLGVGALEVLAVGGGKEAR
jgi:hypothetical protein